jgi:Pretoxin HINT domain/Domain of unknown function (DUF4280)
MEELEYITRKAIISCSEGNAPGLFTPTYNQTVKINGCVAATSVDNIPITNIPSFVICKKTNKSCSPAPTVWEDTYPVKVKGQQTLIGKSCIKCSVSGTIKFETSGQVPLSAEGEAELQQLRDGIQKTHDAEEKEKHKHWWQKAADFVVDCIPIVGPLISMAKNISQGNWGMALLDAGFLALDVVGVAGTPFTGGASLAGTTAVKMGARQAIKAGAKQVAKKLTREAIEAGAKKTARMLEEMSAKKLAGRLCVFACFPAGTPVATKDGLKNIEEIKTGDEVWAYNELTGEIGLKHVRNAFGRETNILVKIEIDGETITATPEHPFYANGEWKEAGLLETGDSIMLFSGRLAKVNEVKYEWAHAPVEISGDTFEDIPEGNAEPQKVYNFEVENWHTYFVGWLKALVHNADKAICVKGVVDKFRRSMSERRKALLRDAADPKSGLSKNARDQIEKSTGKKVPKGHEVSHEKPLYTRRTPAGKRKLDKAENMKTQRKSEHRQRHKQCGDQYHQYGPANSPKNLID